MRQSICKSCPGARCLDLLRSHAVEAFGVREALDRGWWSTRTGTVPPFSTSSAHVGFIEPILEEEGVPADFKYLAVIKRIEPSGQPSGCLWLAIHEADPQYGLEVSATVDERYHVEKATRAACAYLTGHERFGSWVLAAASYNMGRTGVAKALESQHVSTYWDLHLNSETARYVYRMLALREVMESPEMYGFHLGRQDVYAPLDCRTVNVSSDIDDLAEFALSQGTTLRELKAMNPWLRDTHLDVPEGTSYAVSVPA